MKALSCLVLTTLLVLPLGLSAQTSPFLPDSLYHQLVNEISGDRSFENVRHLTPYHKTAGSQDFFAATEWIRGAAEAGGLEEVKLIRQPWDGHGWSCRFGEAWLVEPEFKLASYGDVAMSIADDSRTTHLTAELVDVGAGVAEADYQGKEVKGKVVLASGVVSTVTREAVWKRGALGILSSMTNRPEAFDAPDQVAWGHVPYAAAEEDGVKVGTPGTFAVMISPRRGRWIERQMAAATKPLRVKIDIEASYPDKQEQAMVEAWIRGSEIHDQQIVFTAHIQETTSANDDGSGCANMLEVGRALARLIKEGKIPRPRRDLRFWWVTELSSEPRYFRDNPKEPRRILIDLNQDMVGARQSWGGRVQYASRLPWSLPHPLEDVLESVLTTIRDGNTSFLALRGTKMPTPFSREITAVKGSREPFQARMVPYYDSTDHHAFTPAHVGVAASSLTNWPDEFIHSTADDLENIDATQLGRNAVVVAAVGLYFASVGDEDAPALVAYAAARGRARIAADVATALAHIAEAAPGTREAAFRDARSLVRESYRRETLALAAVRRLGPRGRTADYVAQASGQLESALGAEYTGLERAYTAMTGKNPPNVDLNRDERAMAAKVFVPEADLGALEDALQRVKAVEGLHPLMRFEVYNFADGHRNAYEVYEAVAAEALAAGEWYYGSVRAADVMETLERAARAGAFSVKAAK
ncbi:MAG TPA: M28 family peptidase [Vicinamibacteria bacterium]|nr:M28 family peptidase [Vicinamibacteria bacterium]